MWGRLNNGSEVKLEDILEAGIKIPSPEIYRWNKVDKNETSVAMSVFGIGMQMEQSSVDFYEKAKAKVSSPASNILKEDWWAEQGFAPF